MKLVDALLELYHATKETNQYLDDLHSSGVINMLGATTPLRQAFPSLSLKEGQTMLLFWIKTFGERHG